jgi:hypothetical protein
MASYLQPTQKIAPNGIPVWHKSITTLPGGFKLNITGLTEGEVLKAGSAIAYDESTRIAKAAAADGSDAKVALTKEDILIIADAPVTAVVGGIVYERRIPAIPAPVKAKLPQTIIFSQSF